MTWEELAALASHPDGDPQFGMTPLALRTSGFANGVAELHGDTSRRMWRGLWPDLPLDEVPITSVTNGIHTRELAQPRDARAVRALHRPGAARAARGPDGVGPRGEHPRRRALARPRAVPRAPGDARAQPARAAGVTARGAPRGRRRPAPRRAHHLLRAPLRHLQARQPALPRPGAPRAPPGRREAPGAAHRGRQGPPARRARQGASCGAWCRPPSVPACATGSCSSRTTTCTWRATWCRAPTCGSTCRAARSRRRAPAG